VLYRDLRYEPIRPTSWPMLSLLASTCKAYRHTTLYVPRPQQRTRPGSPLSLASLWQISTLSCGRGPTSSSQCLLWLFCLDTQTWRRPACM